jgi:hypothetical protein
MTIGVVQKLVLANHMPCTLNARIRYRSFNNHYPKTGAILDAIIWLSCFYAAGIAFYSHVEGWTWLQSAYFLTVTMSTVGYGDMAPTVWYSRAVTLLVIVVGIVGVFNHVGDASEKLISPLIYKATQIVRMYVPDRRKISFQGDSLGQREYLIPRSAFIYYGSNMIAGLVLLLLTQLVFAALFLAVMSYNAGPDAPQYTFGTMLYHCYVTVCVNRILTGTPCPLLALIHVCVGLLPLITFESRGSGR